MKMACSLVFWSADKSFASTTWISARFSTTASTALACRQTTIVMAREAGWNGMSDPARRGAVLYVKIIDESSGRTEE